MQPKIGMFDSGVGGLTVARAVRERLPQSSLIYFGDTARAPYGCRSKEELMVFGQEIIGFLISRQVDVVVVACNTSSAHVLEELREVCSVPVIGMIDAAIALAGRCAPGKRVGVLATEATVASGAFERRAMQWNEERPEAERLVWTVSQACPRFVPLVEAGLSDSAEALAAARAYGEAILRTKTEAVILGCTHYPFLRGALRACLGPDVLLLDPADEVAKFVAHGAFGGVRGLRFEDREIGQGAEPPNVRYYVSGSTDLFWQAGRVLMGEGFARELVRQGQLNDVDVGMVRIQP
ncbi:MAG: glutamate racemase [Peptococcaceae bacterium]|nr:glutamate racemase [Peptococcaceae bacterium]